MTHVIPLGAFVLLAVASLVLAAECGIDSPNNASCATLYPKAALCCSQVGWCGQTSAHCDAVQGCQKGGCEWDAWCGLEFESEFPSLPVPVSAHTHPPNTHAHSASANTMFPPLPRMSAALGGQWGGGGREGGRPANMQGRGLVGHADQTP